MENSAIGLKSFFSRTRWFKGDKTQSISPSSNITSSSHFAFHKNLKKLVFGTKDNQRFPKCSQMTCHMAVQKNKQTGTISKNKMIIRLQKWKSLAKKEEKGWKKEEAGYFPESQFCSFESKEKHFFTYLTKGFSTRPPLPQRILYSEQHQEKSASEFPITIVFEGVNVFSVFIWSSH